MSVFTGVLGYPVAHSRSPAMQNAAFAALELDWRYFKLPVPAVRFVETVRSLPGSGFRGANVTIPHKRAALVLADSPTDAARAIGAANTLTFEGGAIEADNTDARGFLMALDSSPAGLRAMVLGSGGAARAVIWALREAGAAEIQVWNRTSERATELAEAFGVSAVNRPGPCDLLVNATSVGLGDTGEDSLASLRLAGLEPPPVVADLVYRFGKDTPVAGWGRDGAARVIDGWEILVQQGALSFERWTGFAPPLAVMRAAARASDLRRFSNFTEVDSSE